jgi:hypothetical protein
MDMLIKLISETIKNFRNRKIKISSELKKSGIKFPKPVNNAEITKFNMTLNPNTMGFDGKEGV